MRESRWPIQRITVCCDIPRRAHHEAKKCLKLCSLPEANPVSPSGVGNLSDIGSSTSRMKTRRTVSALSRPPRGPRNTKPSRSIDRAVSSGRSSSLIGKDRPLPVFGECEDPFVEVQPRELAVEVMGCRILGGCGKGLHQDTDATPQPDPETPLSLPDGEAGQAYLSTTVSTTFATFSRPSSASSSVSVTSFHLSTSIAL